MADKKTQKQFTITEAQVIGDKLGVDWQAYDVKQFQVGLNAELKDGAYNPVTHFATTDPILIGKVVRANLKRSLDYYTDWAQNEKDEQLEHKSKQKDTTEVKKDPAVKKKTVAKKKAAVKKKTVAKKAPAVKKDAVVKKKTVAKKAPAVKKKAVAKKAPAAKKKTAVKESQKKP